MIAVLRAKACSDVFGDTARLALTRGIQDQGSHGHPPNQEGRARARPPATGPRTNGAARRPDEAARRPQGRDDQARAFGGGDAGKLTCRLTEQHAGFDTGDATQAARERGQAGPGVGDARPIRDLDPLAQPRRGLECGNHMDQQERGSEPGRDGGGRPRITLGVAVELDGRDDPRPWPPGCRPTADAAAGCHREGQHAARWFASARRSSWIRRTAWRRP